MSLPGILWRYVLREVGLHTLLGGGAFSLVLVVANLLKDVELLPLIAGASMLHLLGAILPAYLSFTIPAALVCGVMLGVARMVSDGELVAMRAAGIGSSVLVGPVILLGLLSAALIGYVSFDLEPRSHHQLQRLRRDLITRNSLIEPGRVRPLGRGRTLYVAERGDESCPLRGVLISDTRTGQRPYYLAAACGRVVEADTPEQVALALTVGAIHFGDDTTRYDRIEFSRSRVEVWTNEIGFFTKKIQQYSFSELTGEEMQATKYGDQRVWTEIHRRLAFLCSGLLLALVALPLAMRADARRGRSAGAVAAVGLAGAYWCSFSAAQLAAESGLLPPWSVWGPNAVVAVLAFVLLRRSQRATR